MKLIWAPWRSEFIYCRKKKGCIFCLARDSKDDRGNYVVERTRSSFSMLNIYPYNNGHILVAPKKHKATLADLTQKEMLDLMNLLTKTTARLDKALKPDGCNIGVNIGKAAGAGIPGHLHIHIVPRWTGDTNFMPILSETKVVVESLRSLYRRLTDARGR